ncbi:hypothetical protein [Epilithonimonas sp.]|uniref:hypothetical protein n=1 Tax=Epilithonimonas sp. TaxID=2894511 RepID=UPI00289CA2A2|nr:hypothetical protein [Epilithonimonas sp.]
MIGNIFYAVKPGTVTSTQAVDDVNNRTSVKVYPNQARNVLTVSDVAARDSLEIFSSVRYIVSGGTNTKFVKD